jgi:Lon-like protease
VDRSVTGRPDSSSDDGTPLADDGTPLADDGVPPVGDPGVPAQVDDAGTPPPGDDVRRRVLARRRRRRWGLAALVVVFTGTFAAGSFVRLPYFTVAPGSVRNTEALISVEGATTFPDDEGELGYLTVSFSQATPFHLVRAWIDDDIEILDEGAALGGRGRDENQQINRQMMDTAKDVATAVALRSLGFEVNIVGSGAVVIRIEPGTPADGSLSPGDTVVGVDGRVVTTSLELTEALGAARPGQTVVLDVQRAAAALSAHGGGLPGTALPPEAVTVTLAAWPDDPARPLLGVQTTTRDLTYDFPFNVTIDSGNVIGPSAGLAFALGIVDVLTPGSLTGGRNVAITGTISLNGSVGRVGGVQQKAAAALGAGATVLIVPSEEADLARARVGDRMEVVPVDTFLDALEALARISGDRSVLDIVEAQQPAAA